MNLSHDCHVTEEPAKGAVPNYGIPRFLGIRRLGDCPRSTDLQPWGGLYYIYMTQDAVLTVSGTPIAADRQLSLEPGWNLVGWTTIVERTTSGALEGLASDPELVAWGLRPA